MSCSFWNYPNITRVIGTGATMHQQSSFKLGKFASCCFGTVPAQLTFSPLFLFICIKFGAQKVPRLDQGLFSVKSEISLTFKQTVSQTGLIEIEKI